MNADVDVEAKLNVSDSAGRMLEVSKSDCTRSPLNDFAGTSFAASEVWTSANQLRVLPQKHSSDGQSAASGARKYIRSAQSCLMRPRRGRPRGPRLVVRQNRFSAQKTSLRAKRTVKEKEHSPGDQRLLSLGLDNVAPAFSEPSGLEVSSLMEPYLSASIVHSVHLSGGDQLDSQQVRGYVV